MKYVPLDRVNLNKTTPGSFSFGGGEGRLRGMGSGPAPRLTEPQVTHFMEGVLNECHENRVKVYAVVFNAIVLVVFMSVFGCALYICRSNKLTPEQQRAKFVQDQRFVLANIRHFETEKAKNWFTQYLSPVERAREDAAAFYA